jgi:flagellar hook protein FlgE
MNKVCLVAAASALILIACVKQETPIINVYVTNPQNDSASTRFAADSVYNFAQGGLEETGAITDLAIQGKGFFILNKAGKIVYYRRPGRFIMNGQGAWVLGNDTTAHLQALPLVNIDSLVTISSSSSPAIESVTVSQLTDIRCQITNSQANLISPPHATTVVRFGGNLDSDGEGLGTILQTKRFLAGAASGDFLTHLFDGGGNSLGIDIGDILTVRASNASGTQLTSAKLSVESGSTIADLLAAVQIVVNQVDSVISVTLTSAGAINVSTFGKSGPVNNLSVSTNRAGSNLFVTNTLSWGTSILASNVDGASSGRMLRPAVEADLLSNIFDASGQTLGLEDNDVININGAVGSQSISSGTVTYKSAVTTLRQVLDAIQNAFNLSQYDGTPQNNLSVEIIPASMMGDGQPSGAFVIRGRPAEAFSLGNVSIAATNGNNNATAPANFNANMRVAEVQAARDPRQGATSISVYDATGKSHSMTTTFIYSNAPGLWLWQISVDAGDSIVGGNRGKISFGQDGSPAAVTFLDSSQSFKFKPGYDSRVVSIQLDMGKPGRFDGVTQFGDSTTAAARSQDGCPLGRLAELAVDSFTGILFGDFTNGATSPLYRIPVATFLNIAELSYRGGYFSETATSGKAAVTFLTGSNSPELIEAYFEREP